MFVFVLKDKQIPQRGITDAIASPSRDISYCLFSSLLFSSSLYPRIIMMEWKISIYSYLFFVLGLCAAAVPSPQLWIFSQHNLQVLLPSLLFVILLGWAGGEWEESLFFLCWFHPPLVLMIAIRWLATCKYFKGWLILAKQLITLVCFHHLLPLPSLIFFPSFYLIISSFPSLASPYRLLPSCSLLHRCCSQWLQTLCSQFWLCWFKLVGQFKNGITYLSSPLYPHPLSSLFFIFSFCLH